MADEWAWLRKLIREVKTRSFFGYWKSDAEVDAALNSWTDPPPPELVELFRSLRIRALFGESDGAYRLTFSREIRRFPMDEHHEWVWLGMQHGFDLFYPRDVLRAGRPGVHVYRSSNGGFPKDSGLALSAYMKSVVDDYIRRSPRKWPKIVAGARPFSTRELELIEATNRVEVELLKIDESGFAHFRVRNPGPGRARRVGFEVSALRLFGCIFVDVFDLAPGDEAVKTCGVYETILKTPEQRASIVLTRRTEFDPELRAAYSELRR